MWVIILLIVIIVLLVAVLDATHLIYLSILEFFTNSTWGIITLITGILSALLFYASSKSYKNVKLNESFLPKPVHLGTKGKELSMDDVQVTPREFDLSNMTMQVFVEKMAYELTKPGPVFFKGWGNRSLQLDVERIKIMGEYIDEIKRTGKKLMDFHVDVALTYEMMESLTQIKRNEMNKQLAESKVNLDFVNEEYIHRVKMMQLERDRKNAENRLIDAQAQDLEMKAITRKVIAQGEYLIMVAQSKKEKQIAGILRKGAGMLSELPPILKSYVITQLGSDSGEKPNTDMDMHEQLKEFVIRKQKAEARKLEYEADEVGEKTKTSKAKLERERKRYDDN